MRLLEKLPHENARTYAFRVLQHNIVTLELPPGTSISENEIAALMNVSRTPVREALIELNKMELVNILPQRGSYVAKIDYELIEESRFIRLSLETSVLKLLCQEGISDEYRELLHDNLKMQKLHLKDDATHLGAWELDAEFHKLLFGAAGKYRAYHMIQNQMVHFDRLRLLTLNTISVKNSKTINDHENILYALEKQDGELAELIMTQHLTRHRLEQAELRNQYPDYFL